MRAHHWARAFANLGHEVRLIHAKFVRPFVKINKNDWNDAAAICEAAQCPTMRFVATKSLEQQDLLAIHRVRERRVSQRTGLCDQIGGLLLSTESYCRRRLPGFDGPCRRFRRTPRTNSPSGDAH